MNKSFIERIFPHSPGSASPLPKYEDDYSVSSARSTTSPPRILLRDSSPASSSSARQRNTTLSPSQYHSKLSSSLVRHDDPFLQVERTAKNLERTFQRLLDAQSEGLSVGGIGTEEADDVSSVGSPTPTPSVATTALSSGGAPRPKIIPIRQPKSKKITLRGARRGLEKSMREFAALKQHELSLIDHEVVARDEALKQASDLGNRRQLLEDEIHKIKSEDGHAGLRSEVQTVEEEIQRLETMLLELRSKHRILLNQLRQIESSKDSEISSYTESLTMNENQVKTFLRRPPVPQSLNNGQDPGMYALKPERRTLQMAQEQWTSEVETLGQRKTSVENEKNALEEGSKLWHDVVQRIREFEKDLKTQTKELAVHAQSQHQSGGNGMGLDRDAQSASSEDASMSVVLAKLSTLISSLEKDLQHAEAHNWNLLICAIGAELAAFEQARDLLRETAGISSTNSESGNGDVPHSENENRLVGDETPNDEPSPDLLSGQLEDMLERNGTQSPGESSNHSLEDTLREFGNPLDKGKQKMNDEPAGEHEHDGLSASAPLHPRPLSQDFDHEKLDYVPFASAIVRPKPPERMRSESEDDEPGPEFLLSHS
ncbi:hypothetical protein H2200_009131 [Cladophialophora chaetospira]|uniref:Atg28p n=1 Tax=Cladophialophora chaetospira TaxID=386627 RepID=A0AA38X3V6_9EURO|nr:hypothetical protein H2200_009131 [Cladophialophora chaetospira]